MANNGTDGNAAEVEGHEFKIVKKGLDKDQVAAFIGGLLRQRDGLIGERDELVKREGHLLSLTKLAERTVIEANKLTEEMKKEAIEKAKAEAEIEANKLTNEIKKGVMEQAKAEADKIIAKAGEQSQQQARQIYSQLLSQLEDFKRQVTALQEKPGHVLPRTTKEQSPSVSVPAAIAPASDTTPGTSPRLEAIPEAANDKDAGTPGLIQVIGFEDRPEFLENAPAPAGNQGPAAYEKEVELEIMPPVNAMKIMELMRHLDNLPEVLDTELIPRADKPSIIISQREPILHLTDILEALPQVDSVKEATGDDGEGYQRRKIGITLSGRSVSK